MICAVLPGIIEQWQAEKPEDGGPAYESPFKQKSIESDDSFGADGSDETEHLDVATEK